MTLGPVAPAAQAAQAAQGPEQGAPRALGASTSAHAEKTAPASSHQGRDGGLTDITDGAETEFDTVTHPTNAASDHGAVWAEFEI